MRHVYMLHCLWRGRPVRCVHVAMFVEGEASEMCVHVVMFVEGKACEMCVHVVMFVEGKACEMCTCCNVRGGGGL